MPIPFFYGNPDLYAQQLQLQRQMMLAQALQDQAQQPMTPDSWNSMPRVPRAGPGTFLAKIGQSLAGAQLQKQMIGKAADLQRQQLEGIEQQASPHTLTPGETTAAVEANGPPTPAMQD